MFFPKYTAFRKRRGWLRGRVSVVFLVGAALFFIAAHNPALNLAAQDSVGYEQSHVRFAFAQRGFRTYLASKTARERQAYIARVLSRAALAETRENARRPEPGRVVRLGDDVPVKRINHTPLVKAKAAAVRPNQKAARPRGQSRSGAASVARLDHAETADREAAPMADQPSFVGTAPFVRAAKIEVESTVRPRIEVTRRAVAPARRHRTQRKPVVDPSTSPLISDLPAWARAALFQSSR